MKYEFLESFLKDARKLPASLEKTIEDQINKVEVSKKLSDLKNVKKLTGHQHSYRLKMGNYRIGFFYEKGIFEFARIAHRKDFYKLFP